MIGWKQIPGVTQVGRGRRERGRKQCRGDGTHIYGRAIPQSSQEFDTRKDEYEIQFSDIFDQIVSYAAGKPINVVNPAVLQRAALRR